MNYYLIIINQQSVQSDLFLNIQNKDRKALMQKDYGHQYIKKYESLYHIDKNHPKNNYCEIPNGEDNNYGAYNQSYYGPCTKNNHQNQSENNASDLSLIIYQGLNQARKNTCNNKLLNNMEETYKKQLLLEIQLCKQLQGLTMMNLLKEKELSVKERATQLQEDIRILKSQMEQIHNKINNQTNNSNILGYQPLNSVQSSRSAQFNVVKVVNGKIQIQRQSGFSSQIQNQNNNNINKYSLTLSGDNEKYLKPKILKQSQNYSTSPSRCNSFVSSQIMIEGSSSPSNLNQKKLLLIQRRNVLRAQLELAIINADRKRDMMNCQISLLKKQIYLTDECINEYNQLGQKKSCITPTPRRNPSAQEGKELRNPRLQSHDREYKRKKTPNKRLFGLKNKISRPSMFEKAKANNNSPQLHSYRSQNKLQTKYSFLPEKSSIQQSNLKNNFDNNGQQNIRHEYFDNKAFRFPTRRSRQCKSRLKNCYYY